MTTRSTLFGLSRSQSVSIISFLLALASVWTHMEIRIAEINVDLVNLKQNLVQHKTDNHNDFDILRNAMNDDTKEIIHKIDEIQIYLRDHR